MNATSHLMQATLCVAVNGRSGRSGASDPLVRLVSGLSGFSIFVHFRLVDAFL